MRVAALYDVHGNLPALRAVLADVERSGVDSIVCGGDLVAGPMPAACLDRLLELGDSVRFVRGNGDREVTERQAPHGASWCAAQLGDGRLSLVAAWPLTVSIDGALFCHATPRSDSEIVTRLTPDDQLAAALGSQTVRLVVGGHTHVQVDRRLPSGTRFVNAGSVGRPYEGLRGAFWALLEDEEVELMRTSYDVEAAAAAIRATEYPDATDHADQLLDPPDPDEVTAYFEGQRGA
jgi:predicted phosphodiesterase